MGFYDNALTTFHEALTADITTAGAKLTVETLDMQGRVKDAWITTTTAFTVDDEQVSIAVTTIPVFGSLLLPFTGSAIGDVTHFPRTGGGATKSLDESRDIAADDPTVKMNSAGTSDAGQGDCRMVINWW